MGAQIGLHINEINASNKSLTFSIPSTPIRLLQKFQEEVLWITLKGIHVQQLKRLRDVYNLNLMMYVSCRIF